MEEEIEIIQNIIFNKNGDQMNYIDINNGTPDNECETFITAIEHLITRYKEYEVAIDNFMKGKALSTKQLENINKNYIPKSKVKEKIEELNKEDCDKRYDKYDIQDILQEILD